VTVAGRSTALVVCTATSSISTEQRARGAARVADPAALRRGIAQQRRTPRALRRPVASSGQGAALERLAPRTTEERAFNEKIPREPLPRRPSRDTIPVFSFSDHPQP
jgi:hypothetical protein